MNILLVTDLYPINNSETLPKTIEAFALGWIEARHNVTVVRPNIIPNVLIRGRTIQKDGIYYSKGIKIYNKNYPFPFFSNFDFLRNESIDVIISHMPSGTLFAAAASKAFNKPYCVCAHASDIHVIKDFKYLFFKSALKKAFKGASGIFARSIWIKEELEKLFLDKKIMTAPSGIDDVKVVNKFKNGISSVLCVSKLIKRKNVDKIIKALKNTELTLNIIGSGSEEKNLKKLAEGCPNILFHGQKDKSEVFQFLENSEIFILPSTNETFGMVYLEALSRGCITICTKNSGMAGYIKDGINGFLIEPKTESISLCIEKILTLENVQEISKNAVKLAEKLNSRDCAKDYLENVKNSVNKKMFQL